MARALVSGAWTCLPMAIGMTVSDVVYLILACLGLSVVAETWEGLFMFIRFGGSAYLFYLAWKMWNAPVEIEGKEAINVERGWWKGVFQGFPISASNSKVILFYVAFLPTFMDLNVLSVQDIQVISLFTVVALLCGLMLVSFAGS